MRDIDKVLTAAQRRATQKLLKDQIGDVLRREIACVAGREARKIIKANKVEILDMLRKEFRRQLPGAIKRIIQETISKTSLYIDH